MTPRQVIGWEITIVLLLALVLTVEWWRAGELADLAGRVDRLEAPRRRTAKKTAEKETTNA